MTKFSYKAITAAGSEEVGTAETSDRYALARQLKQEGKTLVSVEEEGKEATKRALASNLEKINMMFGTVKLREKIVFARNLSAMLKAGLPLSRALSVMERQTTNKTLERILGELRVAVQGGSTLSMALEVHPKVFPSIFVSMVRAGEEGGQMSESLSSLSIQL